MPTHSTSIDLDVLERTLDFIDVDGADEKQIELIRLYLPFANGSAFPQPKIIEALEREAGGSLAVGWLPVRSDARWAANQNDVAWCRNLAGVMSEVQRTGTVPKNNSGSLGSWLNVQRSTLRKGKLSPGRRANLDASIPGWEATDKSEAAWDAKLAVLMDEVHRTGMIPKSDSGSLGTWLSEQRSAFSSGKLSFKRRMKLDASLPGWELTRYSDATWDAKLAALVAEVQRTGEMPKAESGSLGSWISIQRRVLSKGKLHPERKTKLDAALPGWEITRLSDAAWDAKLAELMAEVRRTGEMPKQASGSLGTWLSGQRSARNTGKLSPERRSKLDTALPGWEITRLSDAAWDAKLAELMAEVRRTGEMPKQASGSLGTWLSGQRSARNTGKLSPERRSKLDTALPGWEITRLSHTGWDAKLAELVAEVERTGAMPKEGSGSLGSWLKNQRSARNTGKLSPERKAKLDAALPGWEVTLLSEASWDAKLAELLEEVERAGAMPTSKSGSLGNWISKQRTALSKGKLSPERKAKLDAAIPGWKVAGRAKR